MLLYPVIALSFASSSLPFRALLPRARLPSPFLPPLQLFRSAGGRVCVEEREKGRSTPAGGQNTEGDTAQGGKGAERGGKRTEREEGSGSADCRPADRGRVACNSVRSALARQRVRERGNGGCKDAAKTVHPPDSSLASSRRGGNCICSPAR